VGVGVGQGRSDPGAAVCVPTRSRTAPSGLAAGVLPLRLARTPLTCPSKVQLLGQTLGRKFISLVVTPGVECKITMPPCSALEIKHAALATSGKLSDRCTLECDLATHQFVLCSLPPDGPKQASLATVVTNDPNAQAWLFLKARGPVAFHVLGRLEYDNRAVKAAEAAGASEIGHDGEGFLTGGWSSAADVKRSTSSTGKRRGGAVAGSDGQQSGGADDDDPDGIIEVLLPDGDDVLEYPLSEAASDDVEDDFVNWMALRTQKGAQKEATDGGGGGGARGGVDRGTKAPTLSSGSSSWGGSGSAAAETQKSGGSRTQRRRAAQKRMAARGDDWEDEAEPPSPAPAPSNKKKAARKQR
jgi:hypothetical protein